MKTFTKNHDRIGFEDGEAWLRFDRLSSGAVVVDRGGEPTLAPANVAELVAWLTPPTRPASPTPNRRA